MGNDLAGPRRHTHGIWSNFWSSVYRSRPKIYGAILFVFDVKFRYMLWVFILTLREGLIVVDFMPFTRGFEWFCLSGKTIPLESTHGEANKSIIFRNPSTKLFPVMVFQFSLLQSRVLLLVSSGTPLITLLRLISKSSWQPRMDSK